MPSPRLSDILRAACDLTNVPLGEMYSPQYRFPRTNAIYAGSARCMTSASFPEISRAMGRKCASSSLTASQRFDSWPAHERDKWLACIAARLSTMPRSKVKHNRADIDYWCAWVDQMFQRVPAWERGNTQSHRCAVARHMAESFAYRCANLRKSA